MNIRVRPKFFIAAWYTLTLTSACGGESKNDADPQQGTGGNEVGDGDGDSITGGTTSSGGNKSDVSGGSGGTGGDDTAVSGGANSSGGSNASGGAGDDCEIISTEFTAPKSARSFGFSGSDEQYSELYEQPCTEDPDCLAPCTERGGREEFCSTSVCVDSEPDYCLPPIKWRKVDGALTESQIVEEAAITYLWPEEGTTLDQLIVSDFGFEIPDRAVINGITVRIRQATADLEQVTDHSVRLVQSGTFSSENLAQTEFWPLELTNKEYGGPSQLWGETWTPQSINAADFGVAIAAQPIDYGGNAYVDVVYVQVHYKLPCE